MKRPFDCKYEMTPLAHFSTGVDNHGFGDDEAFATALRLDWLGWPSPVVIDAEGRVLHGADYVRAMGEVSDDIPYCCIPVANVGDLNREDRVAFEAAEAHFRERAAAPTSQLPKVSARGVTRAGDIWRVGDHTLMCGDAGNTRQVNAMFDAEAADLAFLDPPQHLFDRRDWQGQLETTSELFMASYLKLMHGAFLVVTVDWRNLARFGGVARGLLMEEREVVVWTGGKGPDGALYQSGFRAIAFYRKGEPPHLRNCAPNQKRDNVFTDPPDPVHASALPAALLRRIIEDTTPPGGCVLDVAAGAGFLLDAAEDSSRRAYLMERAPARCDAILRRFTARGGPAPVLKSTGATFAAVEAARSER